MYTYFEQIRRLMLLTGTVLAVLNTSAGALTVERAFSWHSGVFDESATEIIDFDSRSQRIFSVNADAGQVEILALHADSLEHLSALDMSDYGDGVNSLAVSRSLLAVAVEAEKTGERGSIEVFSIADPAAEPVHLKSFPAGYLPDMVTFTHGGSHILAANEGEPAEDYSIDPVGSVTLIDLRGGVQNAQAQEVLFDSFNESKAELQESGVRIFGGVKEIALTGYDASAGTITCDADLSTDWEALYAVLAYTKLDDGETEDDEEKYRIVEVNAAESTIVLSDKLDSDINGVKSLYIADKSSSVAQDLEPEYITVSADDREALIALQENNAFAVLDIEEATFTAIKPLGYKDHSRDGMGLDASEDEDAVTIQAEPLMGMYQPDAICTFVHAGTTYYLSANEGDAREYDVFEEEWKIKDLVLDPATFPTADALQKKSRLGGLKITNTLGDTDGDGDMDQLYVYGARSFSVWSDSATLIWDSGDDFEQITADSLPKNFNSDNDEHSFDSRSGNKGPEPEAVTTGIVNGTPYAFIGLERVGGVMIYDLSTPEKPTFVSYVNHRDFSAPFGDETAAEIEAIGDLGPECIRFIPAAASPKNRAMILVSNEVSGSITVFELGEAEYPVTLLHNNDAESRLINLGEDQPDFGGAARFASLAENLRAAEKRRGNAVYMLSSGDNFLAGPVFNASLDLPAGEPFYDTRVMEQIGYDAVCIGNHDFDFGPAVLADFIAGFSDETPFLSCNINVSAVDTLQSLADAGRIVPQVILGEGDERLGVIGAVTPEIARISSPGKVAVHADLAARIQTQIDALQSEGVTRIVLISHLQSIENDLALAADLSGVDVMIAGGGDELLANAGTPLIPGHKEKVYGDYPLMAEDADGIHLPVVTTPGHYAYLGRLSLTFDGAGKITRIDPGSGPIAVSQSESFLYTVGEKSDMSDDIIAPIAETLEDLGNTLVAEVGVALNAVREQVRTRETNGGNLIADALRWQAAQVHPDFGAAAPHIAMQNGGGIRNSVSKGVGDTITALTTWDMLPFPNFVTIVEELSAAELKEVLENAVSRVEQTDGRFAQISGFSFGYSSDSLPRLLDTAGEVTQQGRRILSATLDDGTPLIADGSPVEGAPAVNLATINFLAGGGDHYPLNHRSAVSLGITYQQALVNYLTDSLGGTVSEALYPAGGQGRINDAATPLLTTAEPRDGIHLIRAVAGRLEMRLNLSVPQEVSLRIFNVQGRAVTPKISKAFDAGRVRISHSLADLAPGIYLLQYSAGDFSGVRRIGIE
ncbi:MAG: choice-of-anchor I family protein [Fibrobacterota bacterium]